MLKEVNRGHSTHRVLRHVKSLAWQYRSTDTRNPTRMGRTDTNSRTLYINYLKQLAVTFEVNTFAFLIFIVTELRKRKYIYIYIIIINYNDINISYINDKLIVFIDNHKIYIQITKNINCWCSSHPWHGPRTGQPG